MNLEGLQRLQDVDQKRDKARRALQVVVDQISDPPFIDQLEAEIRAQQDAATRADQGVRESHAIVETAKRRIEVADNRLYSGSITDHRTLEELQRDLYAQRQHLPTLADAETRATEEARLAHEASEWLDTLRENALDLWNAEQSEYRAQRVEAQKLLDELTEQVEVLRKGLSQEDLDTYDHYRRRRPVVVANVAGGVCEQCRLTLPTIVVTRARRGNRVVECPSCGCILRVT